jgi:hypothetical protein
LQYKKQQLNATMKSTDSAGQAKAAQPIDGTNPNASSGTNADPNTKKRKRTGRPVQQDEEDVSSSLPSPSLPYIPKRHQLVEPGKHNATPTDEDTTAVTPPIPTPFVREENVEWNLINRIVLLMKLVDTLEQQNPPDGDR